MTSRMVAVMRRGLPWLIAAALAPAVAGAADGGLSAADPEGLLAYLQREGYRAELTEDGAGDPEIVSGIEGINYSISFYGCEDHRDCKSLLFSAGFDLPDGLTLARANEWNADRLVGRAHLDEESDPYIQFFVTTVGGLSEETFADVLDWWRVAVDDFKDFIEF